MEAVKTEVTRLVKIGVLSRVDQDATEWAAPSFIHVKDDNTPRLLTDFRGLNAVIRRKPFPLPHIHEITSTLPTFTMATVIDLSMGYYAFALDPKSRQYTATILPWGKYIHNYLPMGLKISSDVLQQALGYLFDDVHNVLVYMDDILILGCSTFKDHLSQIEIVLSRLNSKGLQVNPMKSRWAEEEVDYLVFLITREGLKPQPRKIQGLLDMQEPTNTRDIRSFIGMVNFYKALWPHRSAILKPLTDMSGSKTALKW